jgi:type I restriction enzyme R subunit
MQKEAKARIKINKLLEQAGWRFFDDANKELITRFEQKIRDKLATLWGE